MMNMPKIQIENIFEQNQPKNDKLFITQKRKSSINSSGSKKVNTKIFPKHTSLRELTKKFLNYINNRRLKSFDLKILSADLGIPKRRIYDVTNVLEGK